MHNEENSLLESGRSKGSLAPAGDGGSLTEGGTLKQAIEAAILLPGGLCIVWSFRVQLDRYEGTHSESP
jgi:hypothetical protein